MSLQIMIWTRPSEVATLWFYIFGVCLVGEHCSWHTGHRSWHTVGSSIWGFVHVSRPEPSLRQKACLVEKWWVSGLSFMVFRIGTVGGRWYFCEILFKLRQSSNLNVVLGWFLGGCKWKNTFLSWYLEEFWLITCTTRHMYIRYSTLFLNDTRRDRILEVFKLKSLWQIYLYI